MLNLSLEERALMKAGERLADAAQKALDSGMIGRTELTSALHEFRIAQILLDKKLAAELDSMYQAHTKSYKRLGNDS